ARRHAYDQGHGFASAGPRVVASNLGRWPSSPSAAPATAPAAAPVAAPTPAVPAPAAPAPAATASPTTVSEAPVVPAAALPTSPPEPDAASADPASASRPADGGAMPAPIPPATPLRAVTPGNFGRTAHVLPEPITGAVLRRYREERGISLRDIANQSKIGTRYLEYIEGDRHDMLPAADRKSTRLNS